MKILAMDTSNKALSVAIVDEGEIIAELTTNIAKNHSVRLMPAVEQIMKEANLQPSELDKIAVAKGPGSYTGVRIGLATAKSMAWALNIPVVGISSLQATVYQGRFFDGVVSPFFDARRGLVFTGLYRWTNGKLVLQREEMNVSMEAWLSELKASDQRVLFLSPEIESFRSMIKDALGEKAVIPEAPFHIARASHLAMIGMGETADETHILTPNYLRLAEAEAKWLAAQEDSQNNG
ncbi:tRNA (adenosine(37)-N6)-threonylcarbamoyltransferase complex dimerization subunit type 1 TsaB [Lentibacillus saliphilus]|uniref:tRNA (adenosine(37)-N6)-threonylcarbamoyltransferase complex dimerization subunit type 1 TsaB n=1 Tax=Lentibacillus saliphilus TaxID=2737028 RepID=UPI001C2FF535|nr:tRNA (adenosine(37)-N6)-threonylcarbamoyltransferase complex dimerization subunit type 1 TsaB [Lentibacillus saliphilus]